jgi:Skp family chaperone for outer membrane proteins
MPNHPTNNGPHSNATRSRGSFSGASLAVAMVALGGGLIAGSSLAPAPATVCTVDLSTLFAQSNLNVNLNLRIKAMNSSFEARVKDLDDQIKTKRDELELFEQNSARWAAAQQEVFGLVGSRNAEAKFAQDKMSVEGAKAIAEMYKSVREVIESYAKTQGIDYVMLNDSIARIMPADPDKTMDQIAQRRFLYATPTHDITSAILIEMNKAYPLAPGATPPTTGSTGGANDTATSGTVTGSPGAPAPSAVSATGTRP